MDINASKDTYCKTIELDVGENTIRIDSFKDNELVDTQKRKFYFLSELFEGADEDDAAEFTLSYFHTDAKEKQCVSCHTMSSNIPTDGEAFEDVTETTCLECHNGKFGEYNMDSEGASKYLAPNPIEKECASCHDPHGLNNEFFLRKPIWELCITCHLEKADGKHVVSSYVFGRNSGGHPTEGFKDPARPSREFTCTSCHNPHGSNGIRSLQQIPHKIIL